MSTVRRITSSFTVGFIAMVCCATVGCGDSSVAPVSGVITLDNAPLADVTVSFIPESVENSTAVSTGRTDADGKYSLKNVIDESAGAVIGKHYVRIARNIENKSDVMTAEEQKRAYLPPHDFVFEVKQGKNQADFNLESKKGKK